VRSRGKNLRGVADEVFCPQGAKNTTPKRVKGQKRATIPGKKRRIRFGTSVAFTAFMENVFRAHRIYFTAFREAHPALKPPVVLIFS